MRARKVGQKLWDRQRAMMGIKEPVISVSEQLAETVDFEETIYVPSWEEIEFQHD